MTKTEKNKNADKERQNNKVIGVLKRHIGNTKGGMLDMNLFFPQQ
jgi:hypothetical protein